MKISVILPTYNEAGNILELVSAVEERLCSEAFDFELVVVDDNSPDGTAAIVANRYQNSPFVRLLVRHGERGLASAIKHGILSSSGDIIVVMDTDFNHDPKMIPQMVKFLEYYDIVIGSRFTMGGGMEDVRRYIMSFLYNAFIRVVLRTQVQDNLSGFFSIRREALLKMDLDAVFRGYGEYFIRLLFAAWRLGFTMLEVPVFYQRRRHGDSKSRFLNMFINYTIAVLKLRLTRGHWRQR